MRSLFALINEAENHAKSLQEICTSSKTVSESLKNAYSAAAEMALGKYKFNPITKLNAFNAGRKKLETSLRADSNNVEIRYIRYAIQMSAPSFLGYNKDIATDKTFLLNHLKNMKTKDSELFSMITAFLLVKGKLNQNEIKNINS